MRADVMPGAFYASSPADEAAELPTQDVLPKALPVTEETHEQDLRESLHENLASWGPRPFE